MEKSKVRCVEDEEESVKGRYLQGVLQRAGDDWCEDAGVEDKWSAVKTALVSTAEEVFGKAQRLQPDLFRSHWMDCSLSLLLGMQPTPNSWDRRAWRTSVGLDRLGVQQGELLGRQRTTGSRGKPVRLRESGSGGRKCGRL